MVGLGGFGGGAGFGDLEARAGDRVGGFRGAPGGEVGGGGVFAAGGGGGEGGALAGLEVELQIGEGELGVLLEGRDELTGYRVGGDGAGDLDDDAAFGVVDLDVEVDQLAFGGVLVGAGGAAGGADVDLAGEGLFEQRGDDFDFADLGGGRAVAASTLPTPAWARPQPARPSAEEGSTARPLGRVTTAAFSGGVARASGSSSDWGTSRFTLRPAGLSARAVSGCRARLGAKLSALQPLSEGWADSRERHWGSARLAAAKSRAPALGVPAG